MEIGVLMAITPSGIVLAAQEEKLTVAQGDTVRTSVSFSYRHSHTEPIGVTLHGFIGTRQYGGSFQSVADGKKSLSLPPSTEFTPVEEFVDIGTSSGTLGIGKTPVGIYDLFVRIDEQPDVNAELSQCIEIIEKPPLISSELIGMMVMLMVLGMMGMMMSSAVQGTREEA